MKQKIAICRPIPSTGIKILERHPSYEIVKNSSNKVLSRAKLKELVKGSAAIISLLTDRIDDEIIQVAGPNLKIIANYTVGYDNVDLDAATKHKIMVTNTANSSNRAVAEHAIALMLAASRRLVEADEYMRRGKYRQWDPELFISPGLFGQTLGIIGTGRIGSEVAHSCYHGLGMKIQYFDLQKNEDLERTTHAYHVSLDHLLKTSDFVSLHVPLLPSTHHMINAAKLKIMKPTAVLINTARGQVVDEKALINALKKNTIMAAGLDVFEDETRVNKSLIKLPNVIMTPHIASATRDTRDLMSTMAAENVVAALAGNRPSCLVNVEVLAQ